LFFIGFLEVTLGDVMGDFQSQPRSQPKFMEATISVICNKFKVLKNGEFPIMVRVAKDGFRHVFLVLEIDRTLKDRFLI